MYTKIKYMSDFTTIQNNIILSTAYHKLIEGCAGSHKTSTLIKCAIHDIMINHRPILFLTLVSSVTFEIKERLEQILNIKIKKVNNSNHYIGTYNNVPICISNYDAWIHLLLAHNLNDISCYNHNYYEKTMKIYELVNDEITLLQYNSKQLGLILLDEAQDLDVIKMEIIVKIGAKVSIYIAGDYLQTLFIKHSSKSSSHPMNIFKRLNPAIFNMNMCMRCPKAHILLNNFLLEKIRKDKLIKNMIQNNDNTHDKPFLFPLFPISESTKYNSNAHCSLNAKIICTIIKSLINHDNSIVPDDIAIIVSRSVKNGILYQLETMLNDLYIDIGYDCLNSHVIYMNTYADGYHKTLDWTQTNGKTKLLSIHGDKGKGHKVVFLIGLTENAIPRCDFINTYNELLSISLLNVGLTRSTKYLFIGYTYSKPSRYLQLWNHNVLNLLYSAIDYKTLSHNDYPEPYHTIKNNINIFYTNYNSACDDLIYKTFNKSLKEAYYNSYIPKINSNDIKLYGNYNKLNITQDIIKQFDDVKMFINYDWPNNVDILSFGNKCYFPSLSDEEHYIIMGNICELLINRQMNSLDLFYKMKSNYDNAIFTDDETFISFMFGIDYTMDYYKILYSPYAENYINTHKKLRNDINNAIRYKKNVIHKIFNTHEFREQLEDFTSIKPNHMLQPQCIWNCVLFYSQLSSNYYRPSINLLYDYFNEDLTDIHTNIYNFCKLFDDKDMYYQIDLTVKWAVNKRDLTSYCNESHSNAAVNCHGINNVGFEKTISGCADLYYESNNELIEIKASKLSSFSDQWIIQTFIYAQIMHFLKKGYVSHISIVNIMNGIMYSWNISDLIISYPLSHTINILKYIYNWHYDEIKQIVNK